MAEAEVIETNLTPQLDSGAAPFPDSAPESEPRPSYDGADGLASAADELAKRRAEAEATAIPGERIERAHSELRKAFEQLGGEPPDPDNPDIPKGLDRVTLADELKDKPLSQRAAADLLADYHSSKDQALRDVLAALEQAEQPQPAEQPDGERAEEIEREAAQRAAAAAEAQRQAMLAQQAQQQAQRSADEQRLAAERLMIERFAAVEVPEWSSIAALAAHDPGKAHAELAALAQREPQKFERLKLLAAAADQNARQLNVASQTAALERTREFREWGLQQDKRLVELRPELKDRATMSALQDDALSYLRERGISEEQAKFLWTNDPTFRSAEGQAIMVDAIKAWRAERSMRDLNSLRVKPPAPIRPGVGGCSGAEASSDIANLQQKLRSSRGLSAVRTGAELLRAKREAQRG
jgi:hypothetical protein